MQDPKLSREVELPRSRSNGAAVILVAAMAMFTAVAASAFVVRVRMQRERGAAYRLPAAAVEAVPFDPLPVMLVSADEAGAPAPRADDESPAVAAFRAARETGDHEGALEAYVILLRIGGPELSEGPSSSTRFAGRGRPLSTGVPADIAAEREAIARVYLSKQLAKVADDLERGDCDTVNERLHRLNRLLPDKQLPSRMAGCESQRRGRARGR